LVLLLSTYRGAFMISYEAKGREKLFDILREYHSLSFPETFPTKELTDLRIDFGRIEEQTTSMILRFIYGKDKFVDTSKDLVYFVDKTTKLPSGKLKELYKTKLEQLSSLLEIAKEQDFKMRKAAQAVETK
jgi:hypothetical protein